MSQTASQSAAALPKLCTKCGVRYPEDALFCPADGVPLHLARDVDMRGDRQDPYVGREILDHIEIKSLAGVGAMGRVYRAFQRGIDRDVAVKILHRELSANQQLVARFNREARVASRLAHPNVVQVYLAGQLPEGALYIVMEYLDGLSLHAAMSATLAHADPKPFSLIRALHIGLQLCEAVGEAHVQGIVHRDLKPENVMLVKRGEDADHVKVLDFGIARLTWSEQSMATATGLIFGTARYISPEGAQGQHVGAESDVYSLAILMYQMLTGKPPFDAEQAVALLIQQIHEPAPPLRAQRYGAAVPEPVAAVIMKNLAKDPKARDADARAFGRALVEAARQSGISAEQLMAPSILRDSRLSLVDAVDVRSGNPNVDQAPGAHGVGPGALGHGTVRLPGGGPAAPVVPDASPLAPVLALDARQNVAGTQSPMLQTVRLAPGVAPDLTPEPLVAGIAPRRPVPTVAETLDGDDVPPVRAPVGAAVDVAPEPAVRARPRTEYAEPTPMAPPIHAAAHAAAHATAQRPVTVHAAPGDEPNDPDRLTFHGRNDDSQEEGRHDPRSGRLRSVALVVGCFLLGGAVAGGVAWQRGLFDGRSATVTELDALYTKADVALRQGRILEPAGDNVREHTDAMMRIAPSDPRARDLRSRAARELTAQAVSKKQTDGAEALRLARAATQLDPDDKTASALFAQLDVAAPHDPLVPLKSNKPMVGPAVVPGPTPSGSGTSAATGAVRVALTYAPLQPRRGQSVDFAATILDATAQKTRAPDAAFIISGPGISSRLPATVEGAVYRAALSFFDTGSYTVSFTGTFDGRRASASQVINVGTPGTQPLPTTVPTGPGPSTPSTGPRTRPTGPSVPTAAPTGTVKWL